MASQGPLYPGTAVNELVAPEDDDAWVNPTNVGADDTSEATITAATFDSPDISQRLKTGGYGFTIADGSTIDGILVEIMRRNSAGAASDHRVQLTDETGTLVGQSRADTALDWPTTEALKSYGGSTDVWGGSWTPAKVRDPDFGVTLSAQADAANTDIQVDFIRVTVTYTAVSEVLLDAALAGAGSVAAPLAVDVGFGGVLSGAGAVAAAVAVEPALGAGLTGAGTVAADLAVEGGGGYAAGRLAMLHVGS